MPVRSRQVTVCVSHHASQHGRLFCGRHERRIQPRMPIPLMECSERWKRRQQFRCIHVCGWSGERSCSRASTVSSLSLGCFSVRPQPYKWRNFSHAGITLARQSKTSKVFPKWTGSRAITSELFSDSLCFLGFFHSCTSGGFQLSVARLSVVHESLFYVRVRVCDSADATCRILPRSVADSSSGTLRLLSSMTPSTPTFTFPDSRARQAPAFSGPQKRCFAKLVHHPLRRDRQVWPRQTAHT